MNGREARKLDEKVQSPYYADYDEKTQLYCVFGSESGFAYSNHAGMKEAGEEAERKNNNT